MMGSDLVEKRLRTLPTISAITLPLGLIADLGMNHGGVPWINFSFRFIVVIILMVLIAAAQLWYFKKRGWFD